MVLVFRYFIFNRFIALKSHCTVNTELLVQYKLYTTQLTNNINMLLGSFNSMNTLKKKTPVVEAPSVPPDGGAFATLLANKPPWGIYKAENWNSGTNSLPDSSSNGRAAATLTSGTIAKSAGSGNGAASSIPFISSSNGAVLTWPAGSIPANCTVASLTRYTNASTSKSRILTSITGETDKNWLHGHWSSIRGVCYYNGFITNTTTKGTLTDWLNCCAKTGGSAPNNVLVDGTASGTDINGTSLTTALSINGIEPTVDWAFSRIYIFDQALTNAELVILSNGLTSFLANGAIV